MTGSKAVRRGRLTLVLGGARSGKSRHAQILAMGAPSPWVYIATAEPSDEEMRERIAEHQRARGDGWSTLEAPVDLAGAMAQAPGHAPVVVDCMTLWLSNLMLGEHKIDAALARFNAALDRRGGPTIVVSNEVGGGIVPETPLGRSFRDQAGLLNQTLAMNAQNVVFMIAGLAMTLKALP
jgi:adenosylcobinamide kinase / adenosylcobinamide-phosphate guanylyltransferase